MEAHNGGGKPITMITKHVPNGITSLNLASGCVSIVLALNGQTQAAALLILLAAVFDFLDGLAARVLRAYSPIGKELDSLADVVSFGVAPAMILYHELVYLALTTGSSTFWAWFAFLIPVASALRLAKFNVDNRQDHFFLGLPTPANALFWAFGMAYSFDAEAYPLLHPLYLLPVVILFSGLMVSNVPMFSLKLKSLKGKENIKTWLFLAGCIILMVLLGWEGVAACIGLYIILSLLTGKTLKNNK